MHLLYDISVLALGKMHQSAKTGVHRVVEKVAEELFNFEGIQMSLVCDNSEEFIEAGNNYLKDSIIFSKVHLLKSKSKLKAEFIKSEKSRVIQMISNNSKSSFINSLIKRIYFKFLQLKEVLVSEKNVYRKCDLKYINIYHSPFYPIPSWIRKRKKIKKFITIYDLIPVIYPEYFNQEIKDLFKKIIESIDFSTYILCISNSTKNDLIKYFGSKLDVNKIFVTELAASSMFYKSEDIVYNNSILKKYNIPESKYILSLCTFEPRKNISSVIQSYGKVISENKIHDLNLVLVGTKGWDFDDIFKQIDNLGHLKDKVFITGFVDDKDLAAIYSNAMMFVYPSFYEGFGLPPLEAMQCGVPVITSNNSSLLEVVGDAGLTFDVSNSDVLPELMLDLYMNNDKRNYYSKMGLDRSSFFTWQNTCKKILSAYQSALS
jgi:glycosyltransferase involved in cell wall biosynthesis